jgi:hypothetical protein
MPTVSPGDRPRTTRDTRIPPYVWAAILTGAVAVLLYFYTRG